MSETDSLIVAVSRLLAHHKRSVSTGEDVRSSESDIRAAIRDLFAVSGLARRESMALESNRTDLRTGEAIIEVKRRIGKGTDPDPKHVEQLDGYLDHARQRGDPERLGILTDGKHWALRPSSETGTAFNATVVRTFTLRTEHDADDWELWLRDRIDAHASALRAPTPESVGHSFGTGLVALNDVAELRRLYDDHASDPTVGVKRALWEDLLGSALGEVVSETSDRDGLFVRHTYLAAAAALALQASFHMDIEDIAEHGPSRLIDGSAFAEHVGVRGVIESDFFGWPTETGGGEAWIRGLARRLARYDWNRADYDIGSVLYQSVITAEERQRLGEYYTPDWLAERIVKETVNDPLNQRVLDPACGSGTFLREAIKAYIAAAGAASVPAPEALTALQHSVLGVDVHPVAVHLARAAWVSAASDLIKSADGTVDVSVPVYLGDSLQLRSDTHTLLGQQGVTVHTDPATTGGVHLVLEFPKTLVDSGDEFDSLLMQAATDIEDGLDPVHTLQAAGIAAGADHDMLLSTLRSLKKLHDEGRNHIWAYYTRNLVRPVWLSTAAGQVDRIVGNPPWLTYNKTISSIRAALQQQAKKLYGLWPKPHYVTQANLAGLFYTRCVDLYLRAGGKAAMVMPHSALAAGQYEKWRTGNWGPASADLSREPWNLETLEPNDFFPVPSCVVFSAKSAAHSLSSRVIEWHGSPDTPAMITRKTVHMPGHDTMSPYGPRAHNGATIFPRRLFFVTTTAAKTSLTSSSSAVHPLSSNQDKEPWKSLNVSHLRGTIPNDYIHDIHRGDTLAPFVTLDPLTAILPLRRAATDPPTANPATGDVSLAPLPSVLRRRWKHMATAWEANRTPSSTLSLLEQLDYRSKLSKQIPRAAVRLIYTKSGRPTAAVLEHSDALIDHKLFWIACRSIDEAHYLAAIINSDTLRDAAEPLMAKGQFGARDLHKHLWKLDIREYDPADSIHASLAQLGNTAASEASAALTGLRIQHAKKGRPLTWRVARRELRARLAVSATGQKIETLVKQLNI